MVGKTMRSHSSSIDWTGYATLTDIGWASFHRPGKRDLFLAIYGFGAGMGLR